MNATLRISVFSQTTAGSNNTFTGVELSIHGIDSADVPAEFINDTVMWHDGISVSYDETDHTLTVEKPADAKCSHFDALVGADIAHARHQLAITRRANKNVFDRETELNVPNEAVEAIIARVSGYLSDTDTDPFGNDDALDQLFRLANTDFGAADLFTKDYPLDIIDLQGTAQLV